jgi:hypothetical protein
MKDDPQMLSAEVFKKLRLFFISESLCKANLKNAQR